MEEQCVKARVYGQVQGVLFRASTQEKARALGLTGYVKNLEDGSVEVFACGDEAAVESLVEWLHKGPDRARVDKVDVEGMAYRPRKSFTVK
ncbi:MULTISPECIES: acylphosphatase [Marinobacter]|uniref:acylphosphatase n=1 Tax=Marinobacter TaxID=2742 RepID=UPI000DAC521E|nr:MULTISPECIES: acylphosphatase [Marinobacter]